MTDTAKKEPIVIELDESREPDTTGKTPNPQTRSIPSGKAPAKTAGPAVELTPATAPPVPDLDTPDRPVAMENVTRFVARKPSRIGRLFWAILTGLVGLMVSLAMWDFVTELLLRNLWLGRIALALAGALIVLLLLLAIRELAAFSRLHRVDVLRREVEDLHETGDLQSVQDVSEKLSALYRRRKDMLWARQNLQERGRELFDAEAVMALTEQQLMKPLDALARKEIETASRQVATATAIIPLALADVVVALTANIRMIRRIAEIYGGRSGSFGSWRLLRSVAAHLVATGAVAVGDDMIGSLAGGSMLGKLSRRFGEGVINGALTARVGVAAMEVCRPMPFTVEKRPSVTGLMKNAVSGVFSSAG